MYEYRYTLGYNTSYPEVWSMEYYCCFWMYCCSTGTYTTLVSQDFSKNLNLEQQHQQSHRRER